MYKITIFDKNLCRFIRKRFNVYVDDCEIFSIWHFCPGGRWRAFTSYFGDIAICRAEWFPIVYWLVLFISISGAAYSLHEFLTLMWGARKRVSIWRERHYFVVPYALIRKCRLIGALVMVNVWMLLLYAVIYMSPAHMTPWLVISMSVLGLEFFSLLIQVLLGTTRLDLNSMISLGLPVANCLFVRCVKSVLQRAIENNEASDLQLFKSNLGSWMTARA